jgi:monofunctional biosynthetic peptidoglycan transglycosylase
VRKLRFDWKKIGNPFSLKNLFKWLGSLILLTILLDILYLATIWPDWDELANGTIPESSFIRTYRAEQQANPNLPPLRWTPVSYGQIPTLMRRTVIVAEDARFYSHNGIDIKAIKEVMAYNWSQRQFLFGGSTISQQTVKNLFLNASRNPLRKWHEIVLTLAMERQLKKSTIINLYLNVAELGPGVYGVEAAARYYWQKPAAWLTQEQAIELAASLPAPKNHNPKTRSTFFTNKVEKISQYF